MNTNRRDFLQLLASSAVATTPTTTLAATTRVTVAQAIEAHKRATKNYDAACKAEDALEDAVSPRDCTIRLRPSMPFFGSLEENVSDDAEIIESYDRMVEWYDRLEDGWHNIMPPRAVVLAKLEADKEAKREELRALYLIRKAKEDAIGYTAAAEAVDATHEAEEAALEALKATAPHDLEEARLKANYLANYIQFTLGSQIAGDILRSLI